jgi:general secretion pathway protein B
MSFILDALKKSENDRQDASPAEFTTVPSGGRGAETPRWLWVLGALLLVNAVVLGIFLLRPEAPPPAAAVTAAPAAVAAPTDAPAPAARQAEPEPVPASTSPDSADFSARIAEQEPTTAARPPVPATPTGSGRQTLLLPTLTELRTNGTLNLPDMHLDIHVYSEIPDDRFVFINMSKYRERASTKEGPEVTEITPEGVVLDYQGRTFLLPRE